MLQPLAPMAVRCGGTWEGGMYWGGGPQLPASRWPGTKKPAHNLAESLWLPFATLMTRELEGVDLIVGLSALWRHWGDCPAGTPSTTVCPGAVGWDPRNAAPFIRHSGEAGLAPWGHELGNEPGVWNWTSPRSSPQSSTPPTTRPYTPCWRKSIATASTAKPRRWSGRTPPGGR